jgi:hypothetical protein
MGIFLNIGALGVVDPVVYVSFAISIVGLVLAGIAVMKVIKIARGLGNPNKVYAGNMIENGNSNGIMKGKEN